MIPDFLLKMVGRMKRPDIRLAWREKLTIFWLIFLFNGIVIFYIVIFGRLLCPNYDKAWLTNEVAQHQGENDWWASVQGKVYDLTDFVQGDHSDVRGQASNGVDTLETLAGKDLTYYFPIPLNRGCSGLVSDNTLELLPKNFSNFAPTADHSSGTLTAYPESNLADEYWYQDHFLPKMKKYYKGPLVWDRKNIEAWAKDEEQEK